MKRRLKNDFFIKASLGILILFLGFVFCFLGFIFIFRLDQPALPKPLINTKLNQIKPQVNDKFMQLKAILDKKNQQRKDAEAAKAKKIIFVGDIMLDRGVESLMEKKGYDYPYKQVKDIFNQADLVVGNLEGALVSKPSVEAPHSLKFAFSTKNIEPLQQAGFDVFSLANNHTLNMGKAGLAETRELLAANEFNYFGDPIKCSSEFNYTEGNLVFLGFNPTFNYCTDEEIITAVTQTKKDNPAKFLVVMIHWGIEYKPIHSAAQQALARKMIEAGADLIMGGHPHVVADIEKYQNKLIFYSLGNFIFDQYFSEKTQEGLIIRLELSSKQAKYQILPVSSTFSQPHLLSSEKSAEYLENLAESCPPELAPEVKKGQIIIDF